MKISFLDLRFLFLVVGRGGVKLANGFGVGRKEKGKRD